MKLYDFPSAPNPRVVRIFMAEKGIEIPEARVDLSVGEQFSPAYRAVNPRCVVPTLVLDDGTAIGETVAICLYLEGIFPDPPLMGVDAKDKAVIEMWRRRMEFDGFFAAAEAFRNSAERFAHRSIVGPHDHEQIPALVERGRRRVIEFYADLDARLGETRYVAGDRFTIADIAGIVSVQFAISRLALEPSASLASLSRWRAEVEARPSLKN